MVPQIIFIILTALGAAAVLGTQPIHTYKIGTTIFSVLLEALLFTLGGFFAVFGIPQFIILALFGWSLGNTMINHGETVMYSKTRVMIITIIRVLILMWGGFFA